MTAPHVPVDVMPTFEDRDLEATFRSDGYAIFPLLDEATIEALLVAYWLLIAEAGDGPLSIDYLRGDRTAMRLIRSHVAPMIEEQMGSLFVDHRVVFSTFVVKHPVAGSEMFLHEDRSWVDERRYRSGTLWIPLVDVGPETRNGALDIVRGSHRLADYWSGSFTPDQFRPYEPWLRDHLERPTVDAGSALFYDSRLLHASDPNETDQPRVALVCGVVPREADLVHVMATGSTERTILSVDEEFFIGHGPREIEAGVPAGYAVREVVHDAGRLEPDDVVERLGLDEEAPRPHPVVPADIAPAGGGSWATLAGRRSGGAVEDIGPSGARREVVLGTGERQRLDVVGDQVDVVVLEAAAVATGLAGVDSGRACNPRPGTSYRLEPGAWLLWNAGPGQLRVEVAGEGLKP